MKYDNQDVKCPYCGTSKSFDDYAEIFNTMAYPLEGRYIECCAYNCDTCNEDFTADVYYTLKFSGTSC